MLREFRDYVLMKDICGRAFVDFYYIVGPPAAGIIEQNEALRFAVRYGMVEPLVILAGYTKPLWYR